MRLFSRRKEFQLDDPRLVGMSPLKTNDDEQKNDQQQQQQRIKNDEEGPAANSSKPDVCEDDDTVTASSSSSCSSFERVENGKPQMTQIIGNKIGKDRYSKGEDAHTSSGSGAGAGANKSKRVLMYLPTLQQEEESATASSSSSPPKSRILQGYPNSSLAGGGGGATLLRDQHHRNKKQQGANGNGGSGMSTWNRRTFVTWDSLRRAESTEALTTMTSSSNRSGPPPLLTSSTLNNRRKTLHFYLDEEQLAMEKGKQMQSTSKLSDKMVLAAKEKFSTLRHAHSTSKLNVQSTSSKKKPDPKERKIGRVESLRMLLSKSQSRLTGKNASNKVAAATLNNRKVDKGTDTDGLGPGERQDDDGLTSRLSFFHSSSSSSTSHLPTFDSDMEDLLDSASAYSNGRRRCSLASDFGSPSPSSDAFHMMKTTSCENLSSMTLKRRQLHGRYLANNSDVIAMRMSPPLHKATSTGTMTCSSSTSSSPAFSSSTMGKRSSFPYAYIRSKLTALPEEPNGGSGSSAVAPSNKKPTAKVVVDEKPTVNAPKQKPPRRSLFHRDFFHSMGDLLYSRSSSVISNTTTTATEEEDEEEVESVMMTLPCISRNAKQRTSIRPGQSAISAPPGQRMFDPFTQIRIDLLHKNPSEIDSDSHSGGGDDTPSPQLGWGKRSYSIGDILTESTRKESGGSRSITGSSTNVEEMSSGYDSDSTRNGHESPRTVSKQSQGDTEAEGSETETETRNQTKSSFTEDESDCTLPSSSSPTHSSCSEDTNSKSYGPLAYVTLSRNGENGAGGGTRINTGGKASQPKPATRTLPRSHSISCIVSTSNGLLNKSATQTKKRRKGSVDIATLTRKNSRTSDEDDDEQFTTFGPKTRVILPLDSNQTERTSSAAPSLRLRNKVRDRERPRSQSLCLSIFTVQFEKGPTKKSLGFSVVGGKDSPRGSMGIYIKRIFPYGQACEEGNITEGDEILSVNGQSLSSVTHTEALTIFKGIKSGEVILQIARREKVGTGNL